jgi:hypothetical protein
MTVLALALILGSISVAFAASGKVRLTDIDGNANEEAIQVAYDLGIVTGTPEGSYEPEKAVNRAEFAALIVRALAVPDSALSSYGSTTFKDTSGYGWAVPYLAILQQKGIMKGDGYGNAMPGRTISPNEAVTMLLRAIGYTDNASVLVGQWPANYVSLGQNQLLYEKVANDTQMNKASAAQMIYNVLTKQLVQVDANSTVSYLWDRLVNNTQAKRTLLTTGLNCYQDTTDVDVNGRRVVNYNDAAASKIDLIPKVGAYGILYRSNVDDEVVALTEVETEFIAGRFFYIVAPDGSIKADKFQAVDGKSYNLSTGAKGWAEHLNISSGSTRSTITTGSAFFINGDSSNWLSSGESNAYFYDSTKAPNGKNVPSKLIVAAKVSGLTILELRSVAVWDVNYRGEAFLYEAGQIDGKKFNGHDFPVDENNEVDHYGYAIAGVDSVEDIVADNVVYVYKNEDKKIARIDVGTGTQSGTITNINSVDFLRTIGGKVLLDAPYGDTATWNDLTYINNEGTALLDIYGRTYAFRLSDASKGNFAVYIANQPSFGSEQAKIFDKTGKDVIYTLKSEVYYNSTTVKTSDANTINALNAAKSLSLGNPLIEYKLSGGSLSEVRLGKDVSNGTPAKGHVNASGSIITIEGANYLLDNNTLVYVKTGTNEYSLGSVKDLLDKDIKKDFWYILGKDNKVAALVVDSDDAGAQNVFVLINSITKGSDGVGGEIDVVNGLVFADGALAAPKAINYVDASLRGESYAYGIRPTPYKFRMGEDGVLKASADLGDNALYTDSTTLVVTNPTITGAAFRLLTPGSGGTFTLTIATTSDLEKPATVNASWHGTNAGTVGKLVTFEANTVLYKKESGAWVAYKPTVGSFNSDEEKGVYAFFKTDAKKAYDIIIKIN